MNTFMFIGLYIAVGAVLSAFIIKMTSMDWTEDVFDGIVIMLLWPVAVVFVIMTGIARMFSRIESIVRGWK